MTLFLIFVCVALFLFALLAGGGLVAQNYLYNEPADHFTARALAAAVLVSGFLTAWCVLHTRNPDRYNTFFEFASYTTAPFAEFDAVRWQADPATLNKKPELKKDGGKYAETVTRFKQQPGGKAAPFADDKGQAFKLNTGSAMTAALVVRVEGEPTPVRLDADLKADDRGGLPTYADPARFTEKGGGRYVEAGKLGTLFVTSSGSVAAVLLLNLVHFAVWFAAFWPVMRFSLGHALVLALGFGMITMLAGMPILFKQARKAAGPAVAWRADSPRAPAAVTISARPTA